MQSNDDRLAAQQDQFVPLAVLENALRNWWIIAVLMIAGGLGGLLLSVFRPAVYEATADFSVAIDYASTGPLTQYDEDLAINTAGNLFLSGEVLERVIQQANDEGLPLQRSDLGEKFFLERRFSVWTVRTRDAQPQAALRLAEIWMATGEMVLRDGYQHALQAAALEGYLRGQENCLEKLGAGAPQPEPCNSTTFAQVQQNLSAAGAALYQERQASRGLFSGLLLGQFNAPEVASEPVAAGRGQFVFLGALIGLLTGIVLMEPGGAKWLRLRRTR